MFLYPAMLFGLLAVGIPVVIHLLNKRKYDRVQWAAMRFLLTASEQNQRRLRLEDLLLLLLRCGLIVCLAVALARPVFSKAGSLLGRGSVTAVIAIDNSASMTGTDGVGSRFQNAKTAAAQIIDSLPAGSAVSVLLVSNVVDGVLPSPTYDLSLARKAIHDAALTDRSTDLLPAFRTAFETLKKSPGSKEFYLLTDGQRTGWSQTADVAQLLADAREDVTAKIVLLGPQVHDNVGVSDLRVGGDLVPIDRPLRFETTITNYGTSEIKNATVQLRVDDAGQRGPAENEAVVDSIAAGQSRVVSLFGKLRTAGAHAVTASIAADRMPADDRRTIVVKAVAKLKILLVNGDTTGPAEKTGVTFLRSALLPIPASQLADYFLQVTTIPESQLATTALSDYAVTIAADVADFDPRTADKLADYVHHGGGLILFPGPNTKPAGYNRQLGERLSILPAVLGSPRGDPADQSHFFTLQSEHFEHPIASIWNDGQNGSPAAAHFFRAFSLDPRRHTKYNANAETDGSKAKTVSDTVSSETSSTQKTVSDTVFLADGTVAGFDESVAASAVVVAYADGSPAVVQRGGVILFSSTAGTSWNDLADHGGLFLPLVYRSVASLIARGDRPLNVGVGVPFREFLPMDDLARPVVITDPSGQKSDTTVALQAGRAMLQVSQTPVAGAYQAIATGGTGVAVQFAAQADANESRLEALADTETAELSRGATVIHWTPATVLWSASTARSANDWWIPLAALALLLAAAEPFIANYFSEAK